MAEPLGSGLRAACPRGLTSPDQVPHLSRPQGPPRNPRPGPKPADKPPKTSAAGESRPDHDSRTKTPASATPDPSRWIQA